MNDHPVSIHVADELVRMLDRQKELDPATPEYAQLFSNMEVMIRCADMFVDIFEYLGAAGRLPTPFDESTVTQVTLHPELVKAMQEEEDTRPSTGEAEEEASQTVVEFSLIQVRAALRDAKKRGVDIAGVIKSFGASNLTDLPAEKYGELMKKLEE
jgi:hypothetical protein